MLKVYNVRLYFDGTMGYEVEAHDEEDAEVRAIEMLHNDVPRSVIRLEVNDAVVQLSDNQYTAEQELRDDERRADKKNGV